MTIKPADVPTWIYQETTPAKITQALQNLITYANEIGLPPSDHLVLMPKIGAMNLGFIRLTELEVWSEAFDRVVKCKEYESDSGAFIHYSAEFSYYNEGQLFNVRMVHTVNN